MPIKKRKKAVGSKVPRAKSKAAKNKGSKLMQALRGFSAVLGFIAMYIFLFKIKTRYPIAIILGVLSITGMFYPLFYIHMAQGVFLGLKITSTILFHFFNLIGAKPYK